MNEEEILAERDAALLKYKAAYLKLRQLAQDYLDAEKNLQEMEEDEWVDMCSKHDEAQTALREALKNE